MKRLAPIACGAVLALGAVAGCGGDDGSGESDTTAGGSSSDGGYCSQVEDVKGTIDGMASADTTLADMQSQTDSMHAAADSAPEDVAGSWNKLADASDTIVSALEGAGVTEDDKLQDVLKPGSKPATAMQSAGQKLPNLTEDTKAISDQVKSECDIELSSGTGQ